jgi:hypothetical protein
MVDACLDISVSTLQQKTSWKIYRELSSNATEVRPRGEVGDHECSGGSLLSGEGSLHDCSITKILDVRRRGIDIEGLHAVARVG